METYRGFWEDGEFPRGSLLSGQLREELHNDFMKPSPISLAVIQTMFLFLVFINNFGSTLLELEGGQSSKLNSQSHLPHLHVLS